LNQARRNQARPAFVKRKFAHIGQDWASYGRCCFPAVVSIERELKYPILFGNEFTMDPVIAWIQFSLLADGPTRTVGFLGVMVLAGAGLWVVGRWLLDAPLHPDPWDAQIRTELEDEEASPLCHRCLDPHSPLANFCPRCGAPVGACTNLMPYSYLFSVGHTLRIGTDGEFKHSPLTIVGFLLFAFAQYGPFAPVFWFVFLKRLSRPETPGQLP
jgi:hypothetical protein